jgi:hypothetical protein
MSNSQENIISLQIHQSQLDSLYSAFLNSFFENNAKQMVDLIYRTIQVPFRQKDEQLVILILDKRRQGIITALLIKIHSGSNIQSIETIPLNLQLNGHYLSDLFKVPSSEFSSAVELAKNLLEAKFGDIWTLIALDFNQISKLYTLLNFEPTKELIGKIARSFIDRIKEEKIKLLPVPEVVKAIEKILNSGL